MRKHVELEGGFIDEKIKNSDVNVAVLKRRKREINLFRGVAVITFCQHFFYLVAT